MYWYELQPINLKATTPCPFTGTTVRFDCLTDEGPIGGEATDDACAIKHPPPVSPHVVRVTALLQFAFPISWRNMHSYYHNVCHYAYMYHINFKINTRIFINFDKKTSIWRYWARISKEHRLFWGFLWFFLVSSDRDGKLAVHCALTL